METNFIEEHACANPPMPANGDLHCDTRTTGIECFLTCSPGFGFALKPANVYRCTFDTGIWEPENKYPWPDCSGKRKF